MDAGPTQEWPATSPRARTKRRSTVLSVICVAVLVVAAGLLGYWLGRATAPSSQNSLPRESGPELNVHVEGRQSGGSLTNLSGAVIDVFSPVPLALQRQVLGLSLVSVSAANNPYFVEVGSGTTGRTGNASLSLSAVFDSVESEWATVAAPPTANVSLQLEATYVSVQGDNASFFHYYNQVDFSPLVPVTVLVTTIVLNLSAPYATGPLGAPSPSATAASSGTCGTGVQTAWTTLAFSVTTGNFTVAALLDNLSEPFTELVEESDFWALSPVVEVGFGGVQAAFPGLVEASVSPAWTGIIPNFGAEGTASVALTNSTEIAKVATIDLTGVTYLVVGQREHIVLEGGSPCTEYALNVTFVTSTTPLALTDLPACSVSGCLEIFHSVERANDTEQGLEALPGQTLLHSLTLNASSSVPYSSLVAPDAGYAAALNAEGLALNTSLVFSVNLGEAILLADAASWNCLAACLLNPAQTYWPTLEAQFGPAMSELPSQGVYGFAALIGSSIRPSNEIQSIAYSDQFVDISSAELYLYGGMNQTYLDVNGVLYGTSIPDFGPLVCAAGSAPGRGC